MGEYALVDGQSYKMGTCEDLYYVSLPRLHEWRTQGRIQQEGSETAPANWDDGTYRLRFPFPDEDGADLQAETINYNRMLVVNVTQFPELANFEHDRMCHACQADGFGYNVNVFHPCPQSQEISAFKTSPIHWRVIGISQQKPVNGEVWLVIACPYCGAKARLDWDDAKKVVLVLRQYADEQAKRDATGPATFYNTIADRITAGYRNTQV